MLSMCRDVLHTDPLQFGFTSGVGCSEAIFALKSTINHCKSVANILLSVDVPVLLHYRLLYAATHFFNYL